MEDFYINIAKISICLKAKIVMRELTCLKWF